MAAAEQELQGVQSAQQHSWRGVPILPRCSPSTVQLTSIMSATSAAWALDVPLLQAAAGALLGLELLVLAPELPVLGLLLYWRTNACQQRMRASSVSVSSWNTCTRRPVCQQLQKGKVRGSAVDSCLWLLADRGLGWHASSWYVAQ